MFQRDEDNKHSAAFKSNSKFLRSSICVQGLKEMDLAQVGGWSVPAWGDLKEARIHASCARGPAAALIYLPGTPVIAIRHKTEVLTLRGH